MKGEKGQWYGVVWWWVSLVAREVILSLSLRGFLRFRLDAYVWGGDEAGDWGLVLPWCEDIGTVSVCRAL